MSSPLIDYMKTPMAAPETPSLKRMRVVLMVLCCLVAVGSMLITVLVNVFGLGAAAIMALLVVVTPVHALIYFGKKNRADENFARGEAP